MAGAEASFESDITEPEAVSDLLEFLKTDREATRESHPVPTPGGQDTCMSCPQCGKMYKRKWALQNHIQACSGDNTKRPNKTSTTKPRPNKTSTAKPDGRLSIRYLSKVMGIIKGWKTKQLAQLLKLKDWPTGDLATSARELVQFVIETLKICTSQRFTSTATLDMLAEMTR